MSISSENWLDFKHPLVRQLAFCVASPNLICHLPDELDLTHRFELHSNSVWCTHFQNYLSRLRFLDHHPHALETFLSQLKSTRLGLRFEYLMWFWLLDRDYHAYQLIGHSIQQYQAKNTLGELDFLIRNHDTNEVEHWEVALKYYLGEYNLSLKYWYGLNRSDTLQRKLTHFTQKQFQFNHVLDLEIQQRYAVLKGQLYLASGSQYSLPTWVNTARRLGTWGYQTHPDYYRLQRHEWICPHLTTSSSPNLWWTDGLYHHPIDAQDYMFRIPPLLSVQTHFT